MGKDGVIKKLVKSFLESILEAELFEYLGYEKYSPLGHNPCNSRNGKSSKTILTNEVQIEIKIPFVR